MPTIRSNNDPKFQRERNRLLRIVQHNVRKRRKELKITSYELAEFVGVSQPRISDLERKPDETVSLDTLAVLSVVLKMPASEFLVQKGTIPKKTSDGRSDR